MTDQIAGYDHVAITVEDVDRATDFYRDLFGAQTITDWAPDGTLLIRSIAIGGAVMNIHQQGNGVELVARRPTVGAADLCFRWNGTIAAAEALLKDKGVEIIEGPAPRITSDGRPGLSVYFKD